MPSASLQAIQNGRKGWNTRWVLFTGLCSTCWKNGLTQRKVWSPTPGEEQPHSPIYVGGSPAGKQLTRKGPRSHGGYQFSHEPVICSCMKRSASSWAVLQHCQRVRRGNLSPCCWITWIQPGTSLHNIFYLTGHNKLCLNFLSSGYAWKESAGLLSLLGCDLFF